MKSVIQFKQLKFLLKNSMWLLIAAFFIITVFTSCKKSDGSKPVEYLTLRVLEYKTEKPIAGAAVTLGNCTLPGYTSGCARYTTLQTLTTNVKGEFKFEKKSNIDYISASSNNYWSSSEDSWADIHLEPVAWIKVHTKMTNTYPEKSTLFVGIGSDYNGMAFSYFSPAFRFNDTPHDTTVTITAFGNANDYVSWSVQDSTSTPIPGAIGQTSPQLVNAFDTLSVNIEY
ncbi:MAG: hypothetical protein ACRDE8_14510 [Ginsengibacter sp.]